MNKQLNRLALIILIILVVGVVTSLVVADFLFPSKGWTLEDVNTMLVLRIPHDALNIKIDGRRERAFENLDLSFAAFETDALGFAKQFCNGVLHAGYNPFNALDSKTPSPNAFLIQLNRDYSYFSSSPNTPSTILGDRCMWGGAPTHIRVEKGDKYIATVRLYMFTACGEYCDPEVIFRNYASIR